MPEPVDKSAPETSADAPPTPTPPGSRKKLTMLVSALVLIGGGAAAAWYLGMLPIGGGGRHAEATASIEKQEGGEAAAGGEGEHGGEGKGAGAKQGNGATLPLDTFIANLSDDGGKRYLKTTILVEFLGNAVPPGVNAHLPQIRDLVLTLLTSKSFGDIRTPEGKQQLREEIIARLNQALDRDAVKAVYFTEFIVQ